MRNGHFVQKGFALGIHRYASVHSGCGTAGSHARARNAAHPLIASFPLTPKVSPCATAPVCDAFVFAADSGSRRGGGRA